MRRHEYLSDYKKGPESIDYPKDTKRVQRSSHREKDRQNDLRQRTSANRRGPPWLSSFGEEPRPLKYRNIPCFDTWAALSHGQFCWATLSSLGGHERPLRFADGGNTGAKQATHIIARILETMQGIWNTRGNGLGPQALIQEAFITAGAREKSEETLTTPEIKKTGPRGDYYRNQGRGNAPTSKRIDQGRTYDSEGVHEVRSGGTRKDIKATGFVKASGKEAVTKESHRG
jgi:hypothetical protein